MKNTIIAAEKETSAPISSDVSKIVLSTYYRPWVYGPVSIIKIFVETDATDSQQKWSGKFQKDIGRRFAVRDKNILCDTAHVKRNRR